MPLSSKQRKVGRLVGKEKKKRKEIELVEQKKRGASTKQRGKGKPKAITTENSSGAMCGRPLVSTIVMLPVAGLV